METTKLNICNLALSILGQAALSSLSEVNNRATLCKQYYDIVRQQVLREHDWSFARCQEKLLLVREEDFGNKMAYIYQKPANCLFVSKVYNDALHGGLKEQQFKLEFDNLSKKEVIRTECAEAYAEYTKNITDTSMFDAPFVDAMSALMAYKMAHSLTGSLEITKMAYQQYQMALDGARYVNKVEQLEDAVFLNPYLDVREK